jgi:hypothetical protein
MKRGPKPRKINQDLLEKIEHHAARGLSQKQICDTLGFSETWWHAKKAEYSELGESYKKGSASGLADVTNALYENAMNGNPVSQIFFLKNRDPNRWNDDKTSVSLYRVNRELLWRSNERIVNRGQFT